MEDWKELHGIFMEVDLSDLFDWEQETRVFPLVSSCVPWKGKRRMML